MIAATVLIEGRTPLDRAGHDGVVRMPVESMSMRASMPPTYSPVAW